MDLAQTLLPEPRFADDAQRLAAMQVEADAVDGADGPLIGQEPGAQITHLQQQLR